MREAVRAGVVTTPTLVVDGELHPGRAVCGLGCGARMTGFGFRKETQPRPPTEGRAQKEVHMSSDAVTTVSVEIAGSEITFETGKMAKQASGAVVVRQGDTMVLGTATVGNLRDVDFLPLTVDVEERMYAAGKIPGSFFKREGRAGEKGTLTARMIDRPIRPLFPKGWHFETQLVAIPLSIDHVHPVRHPRDERRLRGADDLRRAAARRRSARCASARSTATSSSTPPRRPSSRAPTSTSSWPAPKRPS